MTLTLKFTRTQLSYFAQVISRLSEISAVELDMLYIHYCIDLAKRLSKRLNAREKPGKLPKSNFTITLAAYEIILVHELIDIYLGMLKIQPGLIWERNFLNDVWNNTKILA